MCCMGSPSQILNSSLFPSSKTIDKKGNLLPSGIENYNRPNKKQSAMNNDNCYV